MNILLRLLMLGMILSVVGVASAANNDPETKLVAMIFDDGPSPENNTKMLEVLARAKARVSFALVGQNVNKHPDLTRAIDVAGHEIVNHSFTHPHFKELDDAAIEKEIRQTQEAIKTACGKTPKWFWAPYGDWDSRIEAAVRKGGLEHFPRGGIRFVSSDDWNQEVSASEIRKRATTGLGSRSVIICHEWRKETLDELPAILAELKRQGFTFVSFSEITARK